MAIPFGSTRKVIRTSRPLIPRGMGTCGRPTGTAIGRPADDEGRTLSATAAHRVSDPAFADVLAVGSAAPELGLVAQAATATRATRVIGEIRMLV